MKSAGPLWIGRIVDPDFCDLMLKNSENTFVESKLLDIIELVKKESKFNPGFYNLDEFCSRLNLPSKKLDTIVRKLMKDGFNVAYTHINNRGFKTDASPKDIDKIIGRL